MDAKQKERILKETKEVLSEREVLSREIEIIQNWKPWSDV